MSQFEPKLTFWDEKILPSELGRYIYGLVDPVTKAIFYIGKGGGIDGQGNERASQHLIEAKHASAGTGAKIAKIQSLWDRGLQPELIIIRRKIASEDAAKVIEASLIQALLYQDSGQILTNKVLHYREEDGLIDMNSMHKILAPKPDFSTIPDFEHLNIWLFKIINTSKKSSLEPALREAWRLNPSLFDPARKNVALGIVGRIALCGIILQGISRIEDASSITKRYRLNGEFFSLAQDHVLSGLLHKDWEHLIEMKAWQRSAWPCVIRFSADGGLRRYQYIYGVGDRTLRALD